MYGRLSQCRFSLNPNTMVLSNKKFVIVIAQNNKTMFSSINPVMFFLLYLKLKACKLAAKLDYILSK
ncbi:hypothetical protein CQA44_09350 [Helicobacter sp. MIT 14-3879]|nr:hypothetical protein CQA44_09350 [Helicobacter sp. MIT 14-3879]